MAAHAFRFETAVGTAAAYNNVGALDLLLDAGHGEHNPGARMSHVFQSRLPTHTMLFCVYRRVCEPHRHPRPHRVHDGGGGGEHEVG